MVVACTQEATAADERSLPMLSRRDFLGAILAAPLVLGATLGAPEPALAASALKAPRIVNWSLKSQAVSLRWKRVAGAKGYQVRLYSSKSLKKVVKTKQASGVTCTVGGLKTGSFYYARVRAFKVSGGKRVYGAWSPKVLVRTKVAKSLYGSGTNITKATRTYLNRFFKCVYLSKVHAHEGGYTKGGLVSVSVLDSRMGNPNVTQVKPFGLIVERDGSIYKDAGYPRSYPRKGKLVIK